MTNPTATREWTTASGIKVKASITLALSQIIDADGDKCQVECCELGCVQAQPSGHPLQIGLYRESGTVKGIGYVARIGSLVLIPEHLALIDDMIREIKAHPAYVAKQARIEKNEREWREMEANRRRNGYCPKCGSYCHGDCQAN